MGQTRAPTLRRQPGFKRSNGTRTRDRAFVVIDGTRHYLGVWATDQAEAKYYSLLAEMRAGVRPALSAAQTGTSTVRSLVARYIEHLEERHQQGRLERPELYRVALAALIKHYGDLPSADFVPKHLIALQRVFVDQGWTSRTVNDRVAQLRRVFRWGANREYTTYERARSLEMIEPVERSLDEHNRVEPVTEEHVTAVMPLVSGPIQAMVSLQLATGARPRARGMPERELVPVAYRCGGEDRSVASTLQ